MKKRHWNLVFPLFSLLLLIGLGVGESVQAKKLYKYQDEKGRWHYSDTKPKTEQTVSEQQMEVFAPKQMVFIQNRGSGERPMLYVVNNYHGAIQVKVHLPVAQNISTSHSMPAIQVVGPRSEAHIVTISPRSRYSSWRYRYEIEYMVGDPNAAPDNYTYRLPVPDQGEFLITQAFGGEFSHTDPQNIHAVDIAMPIGTPVLATRSGVVMHTEEDFHRTGLTSKFASKANHVTVVHSDGTMATYAHLKLESIQVKPGQRVKAGDKLAESGNTGFSSGPHLHFVIRRNKAMDLVSIPFKFEDGRSAAKPAQGMVMSGRRLLATGAGSAASAEPESASEPDASSPIGPGTQEQRWDSSEDWADWITKKARQILEN